MIKKRTKKLVTKYLNKYSTTIAYNKKIGKNKTLAWNIRYFRRDDFHKLHGFINALYYIGKINKKELIELMNKIYFLIK